MLSGTGVITRWIFCICELPALLLGLVFLVCYTPIYYLVKLLTLLKIERITEAKTAVDNKNGRRRPGMPTLKIRHA